MSREISEKTEDLIPQIVYDPEYHENRIEKFMKFVQLKLGVKFDSYWELHEWSCRNFPEFWECVWHFFGIVHSRTYEEVFDRSRSFENMEWFKGARLNYTEIIFKYRDSQVAIIASDAYDNDQYVTYRDLYEEVCQYALSLKNLGVKKGDVIGCYMTNKKEAVFAFLAAASMGAIWGGSLPNFGPKVTVPRLQLLSPKVIFASGNFSVMGHYINLLDTLKIIIDGVTTLQKVIFVPSNTGGVVEDIKQIPKCITLNEFLEDARQRYKRNPWDLEYEQVPFDYPLTIDFTSGTTGQPKACVHSTGSFFAFLKTFGLHLDIKREDVLMNFTPCGWISWNSFVNALHLGTTVCLYDGYPLDESPTRFWDLIDKFGITFMSSTSITFEMLEMNGCVPTSQHSLKSLRHMFAIGRAMKLRSYDFFRRVKPGIFGFSSYGTTETGGAIVGYNSNFPVYKGEHQCISLGMDIKCLDDDGKEVVGKKGYLVLANPYPGLPINFYKDENKQLVREHYLNRCPGFWFVGDEGWINPVTKGFVVFGRCDETLLGGKINCSNVYSALDKFPGINDTVCVSQFIDEKRKERIILFVKMEHGKVLTEEIKEEIRNVLKTTLYFALEPDVIMQVMDIPYNLTGKKLNLLVRNLVNKKPVPNLDFVINPECVDFYKNVDLRHS